MFRAKGNKCMGKLSNIHEPGKILLLRLQPGGDRNSCLKYDLCQTLRECANLTKVTVFNGPGVAGAVLQTPSSLINCKTPDLNLDLPVQQKRSGLLYIRSIGGLFGFSVDQ